MEVAAAFLLIIILAVIAVAGLAVYAIAARLRRRQLDQEGDLVEGPGAPDPAASQRRPEHVRVTDEQRTRFVHDR